MQQILHNFLDNIVEIIWLKGDNFNIEERGVHRVALFKIFKGNAAKLPTAKTEGYMYITQDQGDIYVDISSTERKQLNANYANKLRDSTDTSKLLNKGDLGQAVYFSGGIPVVCREHVDLETDQTIGGVKTFSSPITLGSTATPGGINLYANGYKVNIVGGALTTNQTLTLPNATGTIALTSHTHATSVSWANRTLSITAGGSTAVTADIPTTLTGFNSISSSVFKGELEGNADTATKLKTARTISLSGSVTGSASFDGSGNVTITTTTNHSHSYLPLSGGTLTGVVNSSSTINLYGSNAYFSLATGASATRCYFQTYNPVNAGVDDANLKAGFGFGWANSLTIDKSGNVVAKTVAGAIWNDYAEYRTQEEEVKPGYCVVSNDKGQVSKTTEKLQMCDGIVSDTFGFSIGETDAAKTPLAVAGRVLAYCAGNREDYRAGDIVCAGPEGRVMKMTRKEIREYPDRIIGHVSEIPSYNTWGTGNIAVNGRIWIKVR